LIKINTKGEPAAYDAGANGKSSASTPFRGMHFAIMPYVITEPCIGTIDKSCVDVCPVDCIHGGEDDPQLYIDPNVCIDCGACVSACPVEAIYLEADVPEKWQHYSAINADHFK
jgi:ferredoxin